MPKKDYVIKDFSGGMNLNKWQSLLEDNESYLLDGMRGDRAGRLRGSFKPQEYGSSIVPAYTMMPGEGLYSANSDYVFPAEYDTTGWQPCGAVISENFDNASDWAYVNNSGGSTSGATVSITNNIGITYAAGGANPEHGFIHYTGTPANGGFKTGRWYICNLDWINLTRSSVAAADNWLDHVEVHVGGSVPSNANFPMKPASIVDTSRYGGVVVKSNKFNSNTNMIWNENTTDYTNNRAQSSFMFKTPDAFEGGGSVGTFRIFGTPSGTNGSAQHWALHRVFVGVMPYDVDHRFSHNSHRVKDIWMVGGGELLNIAQDATNTGGLAVLRGHLHQKTYKDSDGDDIGITAPIQTEGTKPAFWEYGGVTRISDGNFANEGIECKISGSFVSGREENFGGNQSSIAVKAGTETITNDLYPSIKNLHHRRYWTAAHDPQSVFVNPDLLGRENLGKRLVVTQNTTGAEPEDLVGDIDIGQIGLSVTRPTANGEEIHENWQKIWKFGISFKLRDGSVTNVQEHGDWCRSGVAGKAVRYCITDPGYDAGRTDGAHTGKTITMASSSSPGDMTLVTHNGVLEAISYPSSPTIRTVNNLETFTIAAAQFPGGGGSIGATGYVYATNSDQQTTVDLTDPSSWPNNPRFELFFKEDFWRWVDNYHTDLGQTMNPFNEDIERITPMGNQGSNFRDPRIEGFLIFAYSAEDITPNTSIPWQPIIEVNLNNKEYINYTADKIWTPLIYDSNKLSAKGEMTTAYRTNDKDSHNGFNNCDNPPSSLAKTFEDDFPYRPDESTKVKWAASCTVNGRAVIGNIIKNGTHHNDRIIVSAPGTMDIFPDDSSWDVGFGDGESIIQLAAFGDKVLCFKQMTMYILNFTDPNGFFVEGEYYNYGINCKSSVCVSDYGVSWVAPNMGIMHFNGQEIIDLSQDKLTATDIGYGLVDNTIGLTNVPAIAYEPKNRILFYVPDAQNETSEAALIYNFKGKDWHLSTKFKYDANDKEAWTNIVPDQAGRLLFYKSDVTGNVYPQHSGVNVTQMINTDSPMYFGSSWPLNVWTKEIDFGDPGAFKHVYKVIFKYKEAALAAGTSNGVTVTAFFDGNWTGGAAFSASTRYLNSAASGVWVVHECLPENPEDFKNIKTMALKLTQTGATTDGNFELDSITIVYRVKGVST